MGQGPIPAPFPSPYTPPGTPADVRKQIHYATDGVQPPSQVYLDVNDSLFTVLYSIDVGVVVLVRYRILKPNGDILVGQEQYVFTNAPRINQAFSLSLTEGFLLSVHASIQGSSPGAHNRGGTRAIIQLFRSASVLHEVLIEGNLDAASNLTWPGGFYEPTASGQGNLRSITGTTPAAGAEISETVPLFARWGPKLFRFQLTTSATVATRGVTLLIDDGVNVLFAIEAPSTQAASLVQQYNYGGIGARADKVFGTNISIPLPQVVLPQNSRIRTLTTAIQTTDQYTAPQYEVEEFIGT